MAAQFDASGFTTSKAKPLPVVLLLDTSGSMYGDKINSLNDAVRKMLATFRKEESQASEFLVSIITFGGTAALFRSPAPRRNLRTPTCTPTGAPHWARQSTWPRSLSRTGRRRRLAPTAR